MRYRIVYFGPAREGAGIDSEEIEIEEEATVAGIATRVVELHPSLAPILPSCRFAVDMRYAGTDEIVPPGAEVALIPPVAGG